MTRATFYLTTAIDYVNSLPHLGTAYEKIAADVLARHARRTGRDTFFCMGNDEHSQNVEREAQAQGLDPLAYCDRMETQFRATWEKLGISYDRFVRTTEPAHRRAVEEVFRRIEARGDIYRARYRGYFCISCEAFLQEKDLVEGRCPVHQVPPQWIEEDNYFFALSRYRDRVLAHVKANPLFIRPEARQNEILRVLEGGLEDVSISRSSRKWGIPLPADPGQAIYVWFDALINYITAAGFPDDEERFGRWWPAQVHIIGKDITRFHCIIWPAMLMSAGLALPESVFGHGFVTFKGERMSKSMGNIVRPLEAVDFLGGPDPLRYFLMREVAFGRDGDFSWEAFVGRYNADLANDLGNLASRTLGMVTRYLEGRVPERGDEGARGEAERDLRAVAAETEERYLAAMDRLEFHAALIATWELVRRANRYVEERAPWTLAAAGEEKRAELESVLYHLLESCRQIALQTAPVMPAKAQALWQAIGLRGQVAEVELPSGLAWRARWEEKMTTGRLAAGPALFPRLEGEGAKKTTEAAPAARPATAAAAAATTAGTAASATAPPEKKSPPPSGERVMTEPTGTVSYAEFARMNLRVATIKAAERVPKTERLLRMDVDLGSETRQIVAGIGAQYAPEALVGTQVVVVTSLEPATIRGLRSDGMLLAAEEEGRIVIVRPEGSVRPGAVVK